MSQPKDFGPDESDPLASPIVNIDQLVELFYQAERPKDQWLLGIEYEVFGQINHGLNPIPYEGPTSITSLFEHLVKKSQHKLDRFHPILEGENIVGLKSERAIVALEPGGQIELAMKPHHFLSDVVKDLRGVVKELDDGAKELDIKLFALGVHPMAKREEMAVVKKARYAIMRNYMGRINGLGLDMMTRSCAIQVNLDYSDQRDMVKKIRRAAVLMPIYALLCSSSAYIEGRIEDHALIRSHIWQKTDPERTGIPKVIFEKEFGYSSWVEMVLDVPMYFIRRGNIYQDVSGASFREFMRNGLNGERATIRDFVDHLSTIFTEVRLKPILELRSPDSLPIPFVNAITAFSWALFYDEMASEKCEALIQDIDHQELLTLRNDIIHQGQEAKFRGRGIFFLASELLDIAEDALKNSAEKNLLLPLIKVVKTNTTVAQWIRSNFAQIDRHNLPELIDSFSLFTTPAV